MMYLFKVTFNAVLFANSSLRYNVKQKLKEFQSNMRQSPTTHGHETSSTADSAIRKKKHFANFMPGSSMQNPSNQEKYSDVRMVQHLEIEIFFAEAHRHKERHQSKS